MIALGRLVEEVAGKPLAEHLAAALFQPLGMRDTGYSPDPSRCARTAADVEPGRVHDPLARAYLKKDRQSGNAGLFSTGDDLAAFCQALLKGRILKPETVALMFRPVPGRELHERGLGWDIFEKPPFKPGVGHTGFTGTLLWLRPDRGRFCVLLTNRTFHGEKTNVSRLREEVLAVVNR